MIGGVEARSDCQVHKAKVASGKVSRAGNFQRTRKRSGSGCKMSRRCSRHGEQKELWNLEARAVTIGFAMNGLIGGITRIAFKTRQRIFFH